MTDVAPTSARPHVVVVEDEERLAELYAMWLRGPFEVSVAHDRETATDLLDGTVDVALLDRNLPDGSGDDLLDTITERGLDCAVAMVTAVSPDFDIIELGFDEYLCKPTSEPELVDTVERLVAQRHYQPAVDELYALSRKRALLESRYSASELRASDEYAALADRIEELRQETTGLVDDFSRTQLTAEFDRLDPTNANG